MERRNAFLGLRGLENSVTRFHDVFVPAENVIGGEGKGLKIALTTLNTGRLSLPAMCVGAGKWSLNVAREWSAERVQWGRPVGQHEAVAKKIAFIAATTYGMESMLDLCCMLADDDRNDIRIEAALVKLFASEMAWQVADELIQIRGGRGYETADSLAARGERAVAVEQILRDLRINRIFEGSTEIMHLLIAREAVDAHLSVAGDIIDPDAGLGRKATRRRAGRRLLRPVAADPGRRPRPDARRVRRVRPARRPPAVRRAGLAQAGPVDVLRRCRRWQGKLERKQGFLGRIVDIGAELFAMSAVVRAGPGGAGRPARRAWSWPTCSAARRGCGSEALFAALWDNTDALDVKAAQARPRRPLRVPGGGHRARRRPTSRGWPPWQPGPSTERGRAPPHPARRLTPPRLG